MEEIDAFESGFHRLTGYTPMTWQRRLFHDCFARGVDQLPSSLDLPTGLGKTCVLAIWYLARKQGANLPRRLVYVVDRRAIVDQATTIADNMANWEEDLVVSTLRGRHLDNRLWLNDPASHAIIVGTVDMIGSRLLFSGYGVSKRMRSYHAGLLGADTLVVLDEAHLVPPFEALVRTIASDTRQFGARGEEQVALIPCCRLLSLSATGRHSDGSTFRLSDDDLRDLIIVRRLNASKRLKVESPVEAPALAKALADRAWERGEGGRRVIVFCNSRKTASTVHGHLVERLDKASGVVRSSKDRDSIEGVELLVGARRVFERMKLAESSTFCRFSNAVEGAGPAFLVCTSAGEVGVDLDADHMVCDLVPWERMVQRLGRVNRRGEFAGSLIDVFPALPDKEAENTADKEMLERWLAPFEAANWSVGKDGRRDASSQALRVLRENVGFRELCASATTPAPLRPPLTRAFIDAWSMTSLDDHPGRPEDITPWLRGWIENQPPQTSILWRRHLPVRQGESVSDSEVDAFFDAAPPHLSEILEIETWQAAAWLVTRALDLTRAARDVPAPGSNEVVAFVSSRGNESWEPYTLAALARHKGNKQLGDRLVRRLSAATLVVDARLAGLEFGLLREASRAEVACADGGDWLPAAPGGTAVVGFRIYPRGEEPPRDTYVFAIRQNEEGEAIETLHIETWTSEESRATASNPQLLTLHHSWTERHALEIADAIGLPGPYRAALGLAARLHDEGKRAARWQSAFNAPGGSEPFAKTKGPINYRRLEGYRHEFGSLPYAARDPAFLALPDRLKDLVLHVVAAHHGRARPIVETSGCDDAPPSVLMTRARAVAERFARLQREWGPWGLAWWEALLRAADQRASRENDCQLVTNEPARARELA